MGDQLLLSDNQTMEEKLQKLQTALDANDAVMKAYTMNINIFFLVIVAIIIYFMQCGFAFLECGAVRSKNTTNILIKNVLDSFVGGVAYWLIGYPFAFGGGNVFIGENYWASYGLPTAQLAHWFFHFVFAATAATIVSGAMAERCEFVAYLIYSFAITGVIYPVASHWAWAGEGWLAQGFTVIDGVGANATEITTVYEDFAGSGVVHLLGGSCALVGAIFLGPRTGRFDDNGIDQGIRGHSVPQAALGGFILFFGFFAFNGGSQASISEAGDGEAVCLAVANTIISGSFAAFVTLIIAKSGICGTSKWSLLTTINGALTGMVSICAGCNAFHPWGAAVVGAIAGLTYIVWSRLIARVKVDDPLDAVAVHGGGGLLGVISVPILKKSGGIVFTWNKAALLGLAWNLAGAGAIIAWSACLCMFIFGILKLFKCLRVSQDLEVKGMDIPKHGEPAYPLMSYGHGWTEYGIALPPEAAGAFIEQQMLNRKYETPELEAHHLKINGVDNHAFKGENGSSNTAPSVEVNVPTNSMDDNTTL